MQKKPASRSGLLSLREKSSPKRAKGSTEERTEIAVQEQLADQQTLRSRDRKGKALLIDLKVFDENMVFFKQRVQFFAQRFGVKSGDLIQIVAEIES